MRVLSRRLLPLLLCATPLAAQTAASLSGAVIDSSGLRVPEAAIRVENPLRAFVRETLSGELGDFVLANIPFGDYLLRASKRGFASVERRLSIRSTIPPVIELRLAPGARQETLEVRAAAGLVDPDATGTRVDLDSRMLERIPAASGGRGLEAALLSLPGFAANANGAIHPRGAHNQMTYVIDGMPVSDQLTSGFANAVDPGVVETVELFTGAIPAEYGGKVSAVVNLTTRSGIGSGRRFQGSLLAGWAGFDTAESTVQASGGTARTGYFGSFQTLKSNRYLDQVSLQNLHNGGNSERGFARVDRQASARDTLRLSAGAGRSSFQLANLPSQHAAGQQQRQKLVDGSISAAWVRAVDPRTTIEAAAGWRGTNALLLPSAGDTPVSASQDRTLNTYTFGAKANRVAGRHQLRAGVDGQRFSVSERFGFAITSPEFNVPGSGGFVPVLRPFDRTRGGEDFSFQAAGHGTLLSGFAQDQFRAGPFRVSAGLRYDAYSFLARGAQWQPRVGISLPWERAGGALRLSYNRTYQTPSNENLLLSNAPEARALGGGGARMRPERQNVFEAGAQQQAGRHILFNAAFFHRDSRDMHDNDNFFNTGVIFPTSLARGRVNGAEFRAAVTPWRGWSGTLSLTHYRAVVTPPFTGGLFLGAASLNLLNAGAFVIDHDQKLGAQAVVSYTGKRWWVTATVRYDSGLVSNPSDPEEVAADPDYRDLLPLVNLRASPARVRPRTITSFSAGYSGWRDGARRWDAQIQLQNVFDVTALYNFQSVFSGTRLVQPRTAGVRLRWYW